jgi:hypothetical protein
MTLRPPRFPNAAPRFETGASVLEAEMLGERASNLGRLGRGVEAALASLAACEAPSGSAARSAVLRAAAEAVWYFFIQREVCGMRDHRAVIAHYAIPRDVLGRLGVVDRAASAAR